MDGKKEGVSVKEIEEFAKKHKFEVFFCLLFLVACVFGLIRIFSPSWNIFFGMAGAAAGVVFPARVEHILKKVFHFAFKQDKTILMVLGAVSLLIAGVFPFVIFLLVGASGGVAIHRMSSQSTV